MFHKYLKRTSVLLNVVFKNVIQIFCNSLLLSAHSISYLESVKISNYNFNQGFVCCFMDFEVLLLSTYTFRIIIASWLVVLLYFDFYIFTLKYTSLRLM
jgi:hypothetical protein